MALDTSMTRPCGVLWSRTAARVPSRFSRLWRRCGWLRSGSTTQWSGFAEGHGLSESRLRVLTRLCHRPSRQLPLGALAEGMDVTPRTMTDIIDVLERDGLVKRVPDPGDRRSVQAVITEAGLERINAMRRDATVKQASVAQGFTADQLVQLRHLCLLLVRNLSSDQEGS